MHTHTNSEKGYAFEERFVTHLIKEFGGRKSTLHEQKTQQIDYVNGNLRMDIKFQPNAYKYKSISVETLEYNIDRPEINILGWIHTSTANAYAWYIGEDTVIIVEKTDLKEAVDLLEGTNQDTTALMRLKLLGCRMSNSTNKQAQIMSASHGSAKFNTAKNAVITIEALKRMPSYYTINFKE